MAVVPNSCPIFSRAGLAAYRWLSRMSEASGCFPRRAMSPLPNLLCIFLDKSNIIGLTLDRRSAWMQRLRRFRWAMRALPNSAPNTVACLARPHYATSRNCVRWLIVKGTETEGRCPKCPLFLKKTCHPTEIAIFFFSGSQIWRSRNASFRSDSAIPKLECSR